MKITSFQFFGAKRGTKGRRLTCKLDNQSVDRAIVKSHDFVHQLKFMSPTKRFAKSLASLE